MQKLGETIPLISTFAAGGPTVYEGVPKEFGELYEYTAPTTPSDIDVAGTKDLIADAEKYGYGDEAGNSSFAIGYVSGMVAVEGLKNAGADLNRETFMEGLEKIKDLDTGGITEPVTYGPGDRVGVSATRPYQYDYDGKAFKAVGEFEDYTEFIKSEYGGNG
jgi:branched-chain amino acid transport system substrate-binding protein